CGNVDFLQSILIMILVRFSHSSLASKERPHTGIAVLRKTVEHFFSCVNAARLWSFPESHKFFFDQASRCPTRTKDGSGNPFNRDQRSRRPNDVAPELV